jgi:tRNA (cytidine32/uridine32-2'-O)-methyltransferase
MPPPVETFRDRIDIVLVRTLQSGNVGSAARAMKNMGLVRLTLVAPQAWEPDKARWMAPGAGDVLDALRITSTVAEAIAGCHWVVGTTARGRKFRWPILEPEAFAKRAFDENGRVAVLFGPEDHGLSNEDLLYCNAILTVKTDLAPSLNVAQSVLVVAWELFQEALQRGYKPAGRRRRSRRGHHDQPAAPRQEMARGNDVPATTERLRLVAERAVEVLSHTAYLLGRQPEQVGLTLYNLLQRAGASEPETEVLLGMLAKAQYAVTHRARQLPGSEE